MIGEEYKAIINEEIDGEATPERSAKLTEYLDSHEEARMYHDDLMRLAHMLGTVESVDPPDELKTNVMDAIHARRNALNPKSDPQKTEHRKEGWPATLVQAFQNHRRLSYAYSFAAGVLVTVGAFALMDDGLRSGGFETGGLTGAMAPVASFVSVDKQTFDQAGIHGVVESKYSSGQVLTEIRIESPTPVDIEIRFDAEAMNLIGFEQGSVGMGAIFEPGRVVLNHTGENRYSFIFEGKSLTGSTLAIRLESAEVLIEKALKVLPESR